jgi:8-oxo-dGTP pyrophosphatase MutT (NUDIX family)
MGGYSASMAPSRPPDRSYHPRRDDHGRAVPIHNPSIASPLEQWLDPAAIAVTVPDGPAPALLNGVALAGWPEPAGWTDHMRWGDADGWAAFDEPPFEPPAGLAPAAGVVTLEPDGRVWLVAPTNGFGGYKLTFPKGKLERGSGHRACARKEAWEESGLRVELTGFLADVSRSTSHTRYYLARRVGGTPVDMGWESQAVWLVPRLRLTEVVTHATDRPLLAALDALRRP